MNLEESFLADIAEHAADDAPRLVYADWLDDHGRGEHAELIRAQIELARLGDDEADRRAVLRAREQALLARQAKGVAGKWLRRELPRNGFPAWAIERGAVERVTVSVARLAKIGEELFSRFPIRALRLTDLENGLAGLAHWPRLRQLEELELIGDLNRVEPAMPALFRSPHFPKLRTLRFWVCDNPPSARCVDAIRHCPALTGLEGLGLTGSFWGSGSNLPAAQVLERLLHAPLLKGLTRLHLTGRAYGPTTLPALCNAPQAGTLRELRLEAVSVQPTATTPGLLGGLFSSVANWLRPGRAPENDPTRLLSGLSSLTLRSCNTRGGPGVPELLSHAALTGLRTLDLAGTSREPASRLDLNRPHLAGLVELSPGRPAPGDAGLAALAGGIYPTRLVRLDLAHAGLGPDSFSLLIGSPRFAGLRQLELGNNRLADRLHQLIESDLPRRLCWLDLRQTGLTDAHAARLIARAGDCPQLSWLDLRGNRLESQTRRRLREVFGPVVRPPRC